MATRRKTARSFSNVRRVKRKNASKNVRHKLKTHRRKHRKIVMRGGGDTYEIYVYQINMLDANTNRKKVKCILVQKRVSGAKDDLFFFWPAYVTKKDLDLTLELFIKPDRMESVSSSVLPKELTLSPSDPLFLSSYLKVQPLLKQSTFERSKYDPTIIVDNMEIALMDNGEQVSRVEQALKDDFDRDELKSRLNQISTKKPEAIEFKGEYTDLINKVKNLIGQYSNEYRDSLCKQASVKYSTVPIAWCIK